MRYLFVSALLLSAANPVFAQELVFSYPLAVPAIGVLMPEAGPANFDLLDVRSEQRELANTNVDVQPHTRFGLKRHFGAAVGYDNQIFHGTLGFYITVAEFGRWNFGVPSPAIGFGRYPRYDPNTKRSVTREEASLFISLASVHYRVGFVRSLGMNCYINLEQVFDMRQNMPGSQIGVSFSSK